MIYLIDGMDGSGKTSIVSFLHELTGYKSINLTTYETDNTTSYENLRKKIEKDIPKKYIKFLNTKCFVKNIEAIVSNQYENTIIDRSFVTTKSFTEYLWESRHNKESRKRFEDYLAKVFLRCETELRSNTNNKDIIMLYVTTEPENVIRNLNKKKVKTETDIWVENNIRRVKCVYDLNFRKLCNWTRFNIAPVVIANNSTLDNLKYRISTIYSILKK